MARRFGKSNRRDETSSRLSRSTQVRNGRTEKPKVSSVLQLQSEYGNAALQRMHAAGALQARLKIGQPGDKFEREADSVADRVMRMPDPAISRAEEKDETAQARPLAGMISPLAQRQPAEEEVKKQPEKEEEKPRARLLQREALDEEEIKKQPEEEKDKVQAKFVQQQGEEKEIKAHPEDEQADRKKMIRRQEEEEAQTQPMKEEEPLRKKPLQTKQEEEDVQKQGAVEEEVKKQPEKEEANAQAKQNGNKTGMVSPRTESGINSIRGGGQPLSPVSRAFFEPRFGVDFSNVRVHADSKAAYLAGSIQAKAFTIGRDVVFGAGQYAPETSGGKHLLAHELTHVVQQRKKVAKESVQRWGPGGHYSLTTNAVNDVFDQPSPSFRNILGASATKMDMKVPEIKFNLGGKIIGGVPLDKTTRVRLLQNHYLNNQFNARNHGEGGCYLQDEATARGTNFRQQDYYLNKARSQERLYRLAPAPAKYPLALPILYDVGDAVHIAQDRGSHGEGATGRGHAWEILTGKNPDDKSVNATGYETAEFNTKSVLYSVFSLLRSIFNLKFFDRLWDQLRRLGRMAKQLIKTLFQEFKRLVNDVISGVVALVKGLLRTVQAVVRGIVALVSVIIRVVPKIISAMLRVANTIVQGIIKGAKRVLRRAISAGRLVLQKAARGLDRSVRFLAKTGRTLYNMGRKGAQRAVNGVSSGITMAMNKTRQAAGKAKVIMFRGFGKVKNTVLSAPGAIRRRVKSSFKWLAGL